MEGFIFQFPDFDDNALNAEQVNFAAPNEFFAEYNKRWPGEWGAVSWEYASIMDLWKAAAEKAGSAEPMGCVGRHEGKAAPASMPSAKPNGGARNSSASTMRWSATGPSW